MNAIPTPLLMGLLTAGLNAAEQKPFMSFYSEVESDARVLGIPGTKHDLPRLSAWIQSDGLQFAVRQFGVGSKRE